jgi:hypothetical protein
LAELSIDTDGIRMLILKAWAALANLPSEEDDDPEEELELDAATSITVEGHDHLVEESEPDHSIDEVRGYIEGLDDDQQAELVALVWIGRGDFEPRDFTEAVREAKAGVSGSVAGYLLNMPLLPGYLEAGLDAVAED